MKKNVLFFNLLVLIIVLQSCISTDNDYSGSWVYNGEGFENTLVLEKISGEKNIYRFTFDGWRVSYDSFANQNIKFLGGMHNAVFIIEIENKKAEYSDDGREFDAEFPLYNDGEDRCKLFFEFIDSTIIVKTESCHFIYGGKGVIFDGAYVKQQ